jgi:hypothetical protein
MQRLDLSDNALTGHLAGIDTTRMEVRLAGWLAVWGMWGPILHVLCLYIRHSGNCMLPRGTCEDSRPRKHMQKYLHGLQETQQSLTN